MSRVRTLAVWLVVLLLAPSLIEAERLPIKTYTTADGLARDRIFCIVQDTRGFLWFCTAEGLSRFDGYGFTNYRTEQGLPSNAVTSFLESREHIYWIATTGGVVRFDPAGAGPSRFQRYSMIGDREAHTPYRLYEDSAGNIWCGTTSNRLYRLAPHDSAFRQFDLQMPNPWVTAVVVDPKGTLWVGTENGLLRREPNGATTRYALEDGFPNEFVMAMLEDHAGRLWVGTRKGLVRMDAPHETHGPPRMRIYTRKDGLPWARIESLLESSDGKLWVGTSEGLAEWTPDHPQDGREFQGYTIVQGLSARAVGAMAEDRDGNLWVGTFGSGAMKIARRGFTTYTEADGAIGTTEALMESRQGEICALSRPESGPVMERFDGRRFVPIRPAFPSHITYWGWGKGQVVLQDRAGDWWIATGEGLSRFARTTRVDQLAGARPKAMYTTRDGLPGNKIFLIFEDSRTDIWIACENGLARWDRRTGRVSALSKSDGVPEENSATAFAEDRSTNVWFSLYHGGVMRYSHGRFTYFGAADGVAGFPGAVFVDSAGRLWIGTSRGLIRVDDPTQAQPRFVIYGAANGLSSDDVGPITEDRWGRIYAATGRGIDRFEPQPSGLGRIQHYTTADGVAAGELNLALRDRQGNLWFATPLGVSQLIPALDRPRTPPPVLVTGVSIGGVPHPISDLGQASVSGLSLHQNSLRIDFVGLGSSPGESLRYQYMLEGADRGWSALTDQRSIVYASLSPGTYRYLVRAVASDGAISPQPASVMFTILPPLWRSWWFIVACGIVASLIIYALHRYRVAQLLAVANVRTRIATDLHDDIGASLSQIAILSEVAQRGANGPGSQIRTPLSEIAGISRELVDSMSDIVWAINPDYDRLSNLVHRMRRFATDLLGGQNIGLQFRSSVSDDELRIGANIRRQVYLIFKEAVNNIARHSGASRVEVELDRVENSLVLRLSDNGKGFDPAAENGGHGLANMRKRAAALGGKVEFQSELSRGASVRMTVPLEAPKTLSILRGK